MRPTAAALALASMVSFCATASANSGRFTSFSATGSRSPNQLTININVSTTGSPATTATDLVYVLGGVIPTTGATFTGTGTFTTLSRTGLGANAFSGSFSITNRKTYE